MKKTIKKIYYLAVVVFITVIISCNVEHEYLHDHEQNGLKTKTLTGFEAKKIENKVKNLISENLKNGKLNKNNLSIQGTVDYSKTILIETEDGEKNYAFYIENTDYTKDEFSNLILREKSDYSTISLIRYSLSEEFATQYYAGNKSFNQFEGVVNTTTIFNDNPCDPVDEPIGIGNNGSGGNGSTGGSGPGSGSNTSGGSGSSSGSGGSIVYLCSDCGRSYDSIGSWAASKACRPYNLIIYISTKRLSTPSEESNEETENSNPCDDGSVTPVFLSTQDAITLRGFYKENFTSAQNEYISNVVNLRDRINNYLLLNTTNGIINQSAKDFVIQLINLAINETNQADVNSLTNIVLLLETNNLDLYSDEFILKLDPYIDLDLNSFVANENITGIPPNSYNLPVGLTIFINYNKLRQLNPEWSKAKCLWYASKEIVHLSLDAFGLIPVVGEVADLTNGLLYAIEGDNLNATLSVASAIPFVGYGATATKYGLKVINSTQTAYVISTKVKLVWKVTANGISFGSSSTLRKVLGMGTLAQDARQAHHIMPWTDLIKKHDIIQKAASSGSAFHMNEALNGIAVAAWRNQPNHFNYTNLIKDKLDAFKLANPNATPQQSYNFVSNLIQQIRAWVISHPNSHLNDLVLP